MDIKVDSQDERIRKIEDIIDIQKANGNINVRQVAFSLPSETDSSISANLAKSLETGLSKVKLEQNRKKTKKLRSKHDKRLTPDVMSWPSDSDITVLRMKLCAGNKIKDKLGNVMLGDGLHQPDSSSMVNLATLILQSQPPSKQSLNVEEYLLPLTSWERSAESDTNKTNIIKEKFHVSDYNNETVSHRAECSQNEGFSYKDEDMCMEVNAKSRVARFLRLYFCPCCTCLYNVEKMHDETSSYFTQGAGQEV